VLNPLRRFLASVLIVLFLALSFNAYACLLPVNGAMPTPMENGCSTPDEQPVSPFCDIFKTLFVQSTDKPPLGSDDLALCQADTVSLTHRVMLTSRSDRASGYPIVDSARDLLLKISVLRI